MATATATIDKSVIPYGTTGTLAVTFTLDGADVGPVSIQLHDANGAVVAHVDNVVLKGEQQPTIDVSAQTDPSHWTVVTTGGGKLQKLSATTFSLGR